MSRIIKELLATNIETKEKISLTSNIKIYSLYENGEYEKYLNELSTLIENEKIIDIYSLFIAFNAEFILNLNNDDILHTIFDNYVSFIKNSFDLLSPSDIKQNRTLCEKGINSFLTFLESNIQNVFNELSQNIEIEIEAIYHDIKDLLSFLDEKEIKYDDRSKSELFNILSRLQKIKEQKQQELNKIEENAISNQEIDNNEQPIKESNIIHKQTTLIGGSTNGSYKWEQLVNKIEILKQLIANDRLLESAIAYEDIETLLTNFDPKEYFPEVFFPYYKKIAPVASKIYMCRDQFSNSVEWKIAKEMYQTDFRSFLSELDRMSENDQIDNLNGGQPQLYNHNSDFNPSHSHENYEDHNEMYRNDNY